MNVNVFFNTSYKQVTPQDDLWSMARMKNRMKMKNWKNESEELAKLKTRKGGLGKNEHPADWQPMKAIQAKMGQWKECYSPVNRKPERAVQAKMGFENEKMKEWNIEKALTTDANIQCLPSTDTPSNGDLYPRTFQGSPPLQVLLPSAMVSIRLSTTVSPKRFSPVNMLQHEPLRAQSSNVLSTFVKLLCQTTNQSCIASIHTCLIMHCMC